MRLSVAKRGLSVVAAVLFLAVSGATTASRAAPSSITSIKHILVLMQENRSFDSYLGQLKAFEELFDALG